jgi:hypothetical protein
VSHDVASLRKICNNDFGAEPAKLGGPVIFTSNGRADG